MYVLNNASRPISRCPQSHGVVQVDNLYLHIPIRQPATLSYVKIRKPAGNQQHFNKLFIYVVTT